MSGAKIRRRTSSSAIRRKACLHCPMAAPDINLNRHLREVHEEAKSHGTKATLVNLDGELKEYRECCQSLDGQQNTPTLAHQKALKLRKFITGISLKTEKFCWKKMKVSSMFGSQITRRRAATVPSPISTH